MNTINFLTKFAFLPKGINSYVEKLSLIADTEFWGNTIDGNKHPVLWNYIAHTYSKLLSEDKLSFSKDNEYCCFNTGLLTSFDECIYALFKKNEYPQTPWFSTGFCKESDPYLSLYCNGTFPNRANFFSDPSRLIYNPNKTIHVNYEHIIKDNKERFSEVLRNKSNREIKDYLTGVIERIKKQLSVNYKIAVPQYYREEIQLLLPLYLTDKSQYPDLALAIREQDSSYSASTCLTIEMAYNNARLIVKPQSDWLKLQ